MIETVHVLVVDDEPGMRLSIERALRNHAAWFEDIEAEVRFRLTTAGSGEEALAVMARDPAQIVFLDYKLPGLSGLEVLQALADQKSEALVVMITASDMP